MQQYFEKFRRYSSNDIGIDLGTANTLVYVRGKGIIINEPSVVSLNQKTNQVVAVGHQAKNMVGRTPGHISAIRPIIGGVISDFEVTEEMIAHLIRRAEMGVRKMLGPRVLVGIPCGVTNVEARAVRDATKNNGAREVLIVEQPMSAAIGIRLPVNEPVGNFIVDIGGGTTDIAVISLGGIVRSKTLKIAGDRLNSDIIAYVRNEFKILIGEKTAENVKMNIGSVSASASPMEAALRGRDLITGLPREVVLTDSDVREAIGQSVGVIVESVKEVIETTPPEIISDVMHRGIYLTGGGAMLKGLSDVIADEVKCPVYIADDPLTAVARGTGIILEGLDSYKDILIEHENALPPVS
jgi:rod shape-determining protein MreB and related proteins